MGSYCSCLKLQLLDEKQLEMPYQLSLDKKVLKPSSESQKHLNTNDIIKLQNFLRGYLDRKHIQSIYQNYVSNSIPMQKRTNDPLTEIPLSLVPSFFFSTLSKIENQYSKFSYSHSNPKLIKRGYIEIEEGGIYLGE